MQLEDATKTGNAIHAISSFIALVRNPQTIRDTSRAFDRWIESILAPRLHTHAHDADPVRAPGLDGTDDDYTVWKSGEEIEEDKQ
ncbi:hypothetical protein EBR77_00580 [bacterium]|nr:hypothetical protein [bacterium]